MIAKRREAILANKRLRRERPEPAVSEYWAEMIAESEGPAAPPTRLRTGGRIARKAGSEPRPVFLPQCVQQRRRV